MCDCICKQMRIVTRCIRESKASSCSKRSQRATVRLRPLDCKDGTGHHLNKEPTLRRRQAMRAQAAQRHLPHRAFSSPLLFEMRSRIIACDVHHRGIVLFQSRGRARRPPWTSTTDKVNRFVGDALDPNGPQGRRGAIVGRDGQRHGPRDGETLRTAIRMACAPLGAPRDKLLQWVARQIALSEVLDLCRRRREALCFESERVRAQHPNPEDCDQPERRACDSSICVVGLGARR
mmetsp:Transcript_34097/g.85004  ORF Transcript_34097/g.85004 Transcript_34097/m.85004 type:complete len:234 (+) Transcript_34097:403-1104(+)